MTIYKDSFIKHGTLKEFGDKTDNTVIEFVSMYSSVRCDSVLWCFLVGKVEVVIKDDCGYYSLLESEEKTINVFGDEYNILDKIEPLIHYISRGGVLS